MSYLCICLLIYLLLSGALTCLYEGQTYKDGEQSAEWNVEQMKYKCGNKGVEYIGCYTNSVTYNPNGQLKSISWQGSLFFRAVTKIVARRVTKLLTQTAEKSKRSRGSHEDHSTITGSSDDTDDCYNC
ncbi:hypothetical protein KIN20_006081 [Parelaphostrongylus tenuis]|uniref:Secreted protein n=1 Tax=Parelaphostrongylus tenuis TaxID=148309 RepID=A0AAD5MJN0_PARTN|nr:hypothetical protein KIN20_006081 [Parelaphostrongylus tenuis]